MSIEEMREENRLLRERLEIMELMYKLQKENEKLRLPKRITPDDWSLMTAGKGGCISFS